MSETVEAPVVRYRLLSKILAYGVYILILLGGYTKAIGAGLACLDWPLCDGKIFPADRVNDPLFWAEYIHRVWAALMGLLMVYIFLSSLKLVQIVPKLKNVSLSLVILVIIQSIFGGLTVLYKLDPLIITGHLGLGVLTFLITVYNYWIVNDYVTSKIN